MSLKQCVSGQRHGMHYGEMCLVCLAPMAEGETDVWGRPIMQPGDGHSAWGCNNRKCSDHPDELYSGFGSTSGPMVATDNFKEEEDDE